MKEVLFLSLLALAPAIASPTARAGVISRDWKTPGDGLLTYDDVNKREWLDLSQTLLTAQFPGSDPSQYVTRENRYQYVVSQTLPGGLFSGFAVAHRADVVALAQSAGVDTRFLGLSNAASATSLAQLLGLTVEKPSGLGISIGLLDEPWSGLGTNGPTRPAAFVDEKPNQAGLGFGEAHFEYAAAPGVMLFRGVPEPAGIGLFAIGLSVLCSTRRCRR